MPSKSARASLNSIQLTVTLVLATVAIVALPGDCQSVQSYTVDAHLRSDDTLDVKEQVIIDFGDEGSFGLYRIIPTGYDTGKVRHTFQFKLLNAAFDRGSSAYRQHISEGAALIQVGDPSVSLRHMRIFDMHYVLRNIVDFSNGPHLRWDPIGYSWLYPIQHLAIKIDTPFNAQAVPLNLSAVIGQNGTTRELSSEKTPRGIEVQANNLSTGDAIVLNIDLPAGSVRKPSFSRQVGWFLADWWPAIFLPILVFCALAAVRWTCGRIEETPQLLAEELALPENLLPAELGTLLDDHCDLLDLTATLFDLAARGYLRIEEVKSVNFVSFSNRDYIFTRLKELDEPQLAEHEKLLMASLFSSEESKLSQTAKLSEVKETFYQHHPAIEAAVYRSLVNKGQLLRTPSEIRRCYVAGGGGLFLTGLVMTLLPEATFFAVGLGLLASGITALMMAPTMPSRTILGCKSLRQTKKFRSFLLTADKGHIQALARGDSSLFGRFLPYALVMGAADRLADGLKDVIKSEPAWYRPYCDEQNGNKFSPESFVTNLGSGMRTIERSFAFSSPSSVGTEMGKT
jgi:hypothetical protein